jgi:hypothetical protein
MDPKGDILDRSAVDTGRRWERPAPAGNPVVWTAALYESPRRGIWQIHYKGTAVETGRPVGQFTNDCCDEGTALKILNNWTEVTA